MKIKFHYIFIVGLAFAAISCKKDNYEAPGTTFSGRVVYQGTPINVEHNQVYIELWQSGFGKNGAIGMPVSQDGTFSSLLFNGNYKLTIPNGQGPFMWKNTGGKPDSVALAITGNQSMDLEVTPYYMVRNTQLTYAGGNVNATFKVEKIITDALNGKDVERVTLFVNKTQFVSGGDNISKTDLVITPTTDWNSVTLTSNVPTISPTQNYVFARVGIKISGIEDMIFSPVTKVQTQ